MKVCVVGAGYVGLATAARIAEVNEDSLDLVVYDINSARIKALKAKTCFIGEKALRNSLYKKVDKFITYTDKLPKSANIYIVAINTNYNKETGNLDTSGIESLVETVGKKNKLIIIKSTIPAGFTSSVQPKAECPVVFMPEFLRENQSYHDTKHPSRVIIGTESYLDNKLISKIPEIFGYPADEVLCMNSYEAELVKLLSNTYLAMRVDYFNDIADFCVKNGLDAENVIKGVSKDPRIGSMYNNPSFGFGGYCLPKDSKQTANIINTTLFKAIPKSNDEHIGEVARRIIKELQKRKTNLLGVYKVAMKSGSDNARESSTLKVLEKIHAKLPNLHVIVYDNPEVIKSEWFEVVSDISVLAQCSIVIANRIDDKLIDTVSDNNIFTLDIFGDN